MALVQSVVTVGTAATTVVAPTNDYVQYVLKNLEPKTSEESAREGDIYLIGQKFTITNGASAAFSILTGPTGAQLDFYEIISDTANVYAELIEGATIVTTGDPITAHNLNRNYSDAHSSVLKATTSVTGGTTISAEYVTATNQAGGGIDSDKVHTLEPNTEYAMRFSNVGTQATTVFFQIGFSEKYNGYNSIWLGTVDNSYVLRAGEELSFTLNPNATINATSLVNGCKLAVMRQD
jgi:hypothetical protein